jgi:hypothetical protein
VINDLVAWFTNVWQWINSPNGENDWAWLLAMALVLLYLVAGPKKKRR